MKAVANEIEVRLPGVAERTDADIAAAVVRALEWDAVGRHREDRRHRLQGLGDAKGEVEWQYQKDDAERVVRRLTASRA